MLFSPQILVVEDEFLIAMQLEEILRRAGYGVMGPAGNVTTALELLRRERPDAAVLEFSVAGQRITAVAEFLRDMSVPFLLASGHSAADLRYDEVLRNVVNIGKPIVTPRLLSSLDQLLRLN